MDASFLNVFEHAGDEHGLAIAEGIDVDLGGARQILVDQHRRVAADGQGGLDVAGQLFLVADDLHGPAAEHVGGPDDHREADLAGAFEGFLSATGGGVDWLGDAEGMQQVLEAFAVLGEVEGVGGGAEDRDALVG